MALNLAYAVAIYEVSREYGGPEEGGWWYDTGELVYVEYTHTEAFAWFRAERLRGGEYASTGNAYSVLYRGGDYRAEVRNRVYDGEPPQSYPEEYPRYE